MRRGVILADDHQIPESHCRAHEREVISSGKDDKHIVPPIRLFWWRESRRPEKAGSSIARVYTS